MQQTATAYLMQALKWAAGIALGGNQSGNSSSSSNRNRGRAGSLSSHDFRDSRFGGVARDGGRGDSAKEGGTDADAFVAAHSG